MGPGSERVGRLKDFCTCVCVRWEEKGYCAPTNVFLSHLDSFLITSLNLKVFGMKPESGSPEAFYHERSGSVAAVNLPILLVLSGIVRGTVCGIQIHFPFCLIAWFLLDANGWNHFYATLNISVNMYEFYFTRAGKLYSSLHIDLSVSHRLWCFKSLIKKAHCHLIGSLKMSVKGT